MNITKVCPAAPVAELEEAAQRFGIDTKLRRARYGSGNYTPPKGPFPTLGP